MLKKMTSGGVIFVFLLLSIATGIVSAAEKKGQPPGIPGNIRIIPADAKPFTVGILLDESYNSHSMNMGHVAAGDYVHRTIPNCRIMTRVFPGNTEDISIVDVVGEMIKDGADLIVGTSRKMQDGFAKAAAKYPNTDFIHVSGDDVLENRAPDNLANLSVRMYYGQMIAGYAAALKSETGKIAYLSPYDNNETRRHAVAAFLGARYAIESVKGMPASNLVFKAVLGENADSAKNIKGLENDGVDVIISGLGIEGIAFPENKAGIWAVPYSDKAACGERPDVCICSPVANWGPGYVRLVRQSSRRAFESAWLWLEPNWENINVAGASSVVFGKGPALDADSAKFVDEFIEDLGSQRVNLFKGPLFFKDGSVFLKQDEEASDKKIWYMKSLLKGMM